MKLVFVTEARFIRDVQGDVYGDGSFNVELWNRYLTMFSEVIVMARVQYNKDYVGTLNGLSSAEKVSFIEIPYFIGPLQYLKKRKEIRIKVEQSIDQTNAVFICRVPGTISNIVIKQLSEKRIPFGIELVGDPWDVFAPGGIKHPLRAYFRWKGYLDLKRNALQAAALLYVTLNTLQRRYAGKDGVFQIGVSDVKIKDELIQIKEKQHQVKKEYQVVSIGSLEQMYKAPDIVLEALKRVNDAGLACKLIWLGDGVYRSEMESLSKELGIDKLVEFKGNVSASKVRSYLLEADIFVLASRTEGLPRAVIEAMAVGLPCIGTQVGGIPELLEKNALIPKNNPVALSEKIQDLINNPEFYNKQASRNLSESLKYKESILLQKRAAFYEYLIKLKI